MKKAYLFPGQAAQFVGMGTQLAASREEAKALLDKADEVLGYSLSQIMSEGPQELLTETRYTQPAVFVHSLMVYEKSDKSAPITAMAGHSLGELTACVAAGALSFEDGLRLVHARATAMQVACDANPGTMAAILGMEDDQVAEICKDIDGVVPANFNCPGQLVISGTKEGITKAVEIFKEKGARRALEIQVGGAFHSPLMQPALESFEAAIADISFEDARVPIYQNVDTMPHQKAAEIKANLIKQVTNPVRWTSSILRMINDGINQFVEVGGKGKILAGMMRKISREVEMDIWGEE